LVLLILAQFSSMKISLLLILVLLRVACVAQEQDTVRVLEEVVVRAYESNRPILQVPASIGLVLNSDLSRFSNTSLVSAVNNIPGIRMEERSPGSYRFSIRGSTLRSPFGVRNVKVYWNELPLTDPGGNTYLNQLDPNSISQIEIIKGPGSSMYGAGTGGVILLNSTQPENESVLSASWMGGSYGLSNYQFSFLQGNQNTSHAVGYQHQQADGYREQTRMVRDQLNSTFKFTINDKEVLETAIFYTDLYYQTPGGLTEAEYNANPRQARPATGAQPGAVAQQAGVSLRSFYTGVSHQYKFSDKLSNRTGVYGNFVQFNNSSIRNYERRTEQNFGARTVTDYNETIGRWQLNLKGGGEFQHGFAPVKTYRNLGGYPGLLNSDEELRTIQYSVFGQGELRKNNWILSGGLSANWVNYYLVQLNQSPAQEQEVKYDPILTPRIALLRKINEALSVHANVSYGFSPPTLAEVLPSNGVFNASLKPEKGAQVEIGAKGYFAQRRIFIDMALYHFALNETIVVRRDEDGADYFVNAGSTNQNGLELLINWQPRMSSSLFTGFKIWSGVTLNQYEFEDYTKDNTSYDGNQLTGTPKQIFTGGVDLNLFKNIYLYLTANHTAEIPLNDANTAFAKPYTLIGSRIAYKIDASKKLPLELFMGADNLLDQTYSLGNDLNAAAGRYYNAAPGRNYYFGLKMGLNLTNR
jgi:iron complex outermembrane recepter protein